LSNKFLNSKARKIRRIFYLNWDLEIVVENEEIAEEKERKEELEDEVQRCLEKLPFLEKEFIRYFYFEGLPYKQISLLLKTNQRKLERMHKNILKQLKILLKDFVEKRFKLKIADEKLCPICLHPKREELEKILDSKRKEESFKRILRIFKEKFQLEISTPVVNYNSS
jgi:hypothetical protein